MLVEVPHGGRIGNVCGMCDVTAHRLLFQRLNQSVATHAARVGGSFHFDYSHIPIAPSDGTLVLSCRQCVCPTRYRLTILGNIVSYRLIGDSIATTCFHSDAGEPPVRNHALIIAHGDNPHGGMRLCISNILYHTKKAMANNKLTFNNENFII